MATSSNDSEVHDERAGARDGVDALRALEAILRRIVDDRTTGRVTAEVRRELEAQLGALRAAIEPVEGLRRQLAVVEGQLAGARETLQRLESDRVMTSQRLDEVRTTLGRRLDESAAELASVGARVARPAVQQIVEDEARRAAQELLVPRIDARLHELEEAFGYTDDKLVRLQHLIDQYGPGGLPVLKQENDELKHALAERRTQLDAQAAEIAELRERVLEQERAAARLRLVEGLPPPAVIEEKWREIQRVDQGLPARAALEAERTKLAAENQQLRDQLAGWEQRAVVAERSRVDERRLAKLEQDAVADAQKLAHAEDEKRRALLAERQATNRVRELEDTLRGLQAAEATAAEREHRLDALTREVTELTRALEDRSRACEEQRLLAMKLGQELRDRRAELDARDRHEAELEARWMQVHADELRVAHAELTAQLRQWAEEKARTLAANESALLRDASAELARRKGVDEDNGRLRLEVTELAQELAHERALHESHRTRVDAELQRGYHQEREAIEQRASFLAERVAYEDERRRVEEERLRARITDERERMLAQVKEDTQRHHAAQDERRQLELDLHRLAGEKGAAEAQLALVRQSLDDLRGKVLERHERLRQVRTPLLDSLPPLRQDAIDEEGWLAEIQKGLREAGYVFHPRLVRAFHTSLKIQRDAPLTVLAGISGTGKSQLPRLFADLGGLTFLPIAVQPGWDSPANLFGFFNYTDGRIKAEPLARLLHQVSRDDDPLRAGVSVVMLDEMNLARVEYYFSELLSKLESRRGASGEVGRRRASYELDVGAGEDPELLYLDERVLFVGTMNEDESTLTLSAKVIDRASLLAFPSPHAMTIAAQPARAPDRPRLPREVWQGWIRDGEEHAISEKLNEVNEVMDSLDLPFGFRLFRAIHAYVANYRGAPEDAWSDQWNMKILPRLRGVETGVAEVRRGLDALAALVPDDLRDAFTRARRRDYFAWTGARELYRAD